MHELSMAEAIVETVLDVAEKNDAQEIVEVTIEVGELTMLNPEQVKFLLGVLAEDTLLEGAEIIIEEVPVEIKCRNCEFTGLANTDGSDHYLAIVLCPKCNERNVEILKGRECNVKTIKIEKSDENA
ncbi:hydrogenase maturation nickel metallochaperone HypA [Methanobacterium petrolearium]|uniref:hydrogenase maturation nickel metallochaperone HypA n=1 Tax=Methanobacterium petrolearium TaxID=710190 RepID=UPI001AE7E7AB|nr:hydrogenase maturation nickel metallochaperone HypA [Methanobacterium petrolearium]MBP1946097.1 hydrogenase nickel incorporation protein HypA/HybF [Methanobacterium petrolearium]BDZ70765.1 hydrogenase maturation nickel metallochaperone HypA [Methanobacterium petrolearium]